MNTTVEHKEYNYTFFDWQVDKMLIIQWKKEMDEV